MTTNTHVRELGDVELLTCTAALVKRSNEVTAELLLHLGEVDARKLYLGRAFPSMFAFCVGSLGLSEDATCNLLTVARLARRLPVTLQALRDGRVHLTGLRLLAPHLAEENVAAVLTDATGKSKRHVEELVARLAPRPAVPDAIRRLPQPTRAVLPFASPATVPTGGSAEELRGEIASPPDSVTTGPARDDDDEALPVPSFATAAPARDVDDAAPPASPAAGPAEPPPAATPARRAAVTPLAPEAFKVQFTATRSLRDKLVQAQGLLRHSIPDGALAAVIERAVDCLLADVKKKRFGVGCTPRARRGEAQPGSGTVVARDPDGAPPRDDGAAEAPSSGGAPSPSSRHVPSDVRRAVYARDEGRCTFVDEAGRRCSETGGLEFDHVDGFARTHVHSVQGLRLRCGPHNQYAAELMYGRAFMAAARSRASNARARVSAPGRMEPPR